MTKRDKQILLDAAELIATDRKTFSCSAISLASKHEGSLRDRYALFYGESGMPGHYWGRFTGGSRHDASRRILMPLWFREVGLEGVGL